MTEAKLPSLTPFLLHLSTHSEVEELLINKIHSVFKDTSEEIIWINKLLEPLSIEMVRNVSQMLSFASYQGSYRHVVLLGIDEASTEAQNALLKLLEEPPTKTQFWLTSTNSGYILPTIISRCQEIIEITKNDRAISDATKEIVEIIPSSSYRQLSDIAEKYSDREAAAELIKEIIFYCHQQLKSKPSQQRQILTHALQAQKYLDANVNVRQTLENFFFTTKHLWSE